MRLLVLLLALVAAPAAAFQEPQRGEPLRGELLDTVRAPVEERFGAPIVFVVGDLRVQGSVGFAALSPMRPGSSPRRFQAWWEALPEGDPNFVADVHALLRRIGGRWTVVDWTIGSGEVWWSDPTVCADYKSVVPDACD